MFSLLITIGSFLFVFGVLVILHELGHFLTARLFKVKVEEFAFGMPPRIFAVKKGETAYALNAIPIGGYVRLEGEDGSDSPAPTSFQNKPAWQRIIILLAGSVVHLILAIVIFSLFIFRQGEAIPNHTVQIAGITDNSPAAEANLLPGDTILTINGLAITEVEQFQAATADKAGQLISIEVQTESGDERTVTLTPRPDPPEGEGAVGVFISSGYDLQSVNFFRSFWLGTRFTYVIVDESFQAIGGLFSSILLKASVPEGVSGPIGIARVSGETAQASGFSGLFFLIGILGANLAVLNLFPIPGLDGGRIIIILIELVRRKKLSPQREALVQGLGLAFVLLILAVVTFKDVASLIS
ncbi:MAG TPA: M50 family metallopeptidase [bacterium]|nr:M50 family metallopeptidase [bacterium]